MISRESIAYQQPPITEAVIGIDFATSLDSKVLNTANEAFKKNYPVHQFVTEYALAVDIQNQGGGAPKAKAELTPAHKHRRSSTDMTEIVLIQPGSFIVSQLAPYPGWEPFVKRFLREWRVLKRATGHREVRRVGVRFINRIDVPIVDDRAEHEQYLNVFPSVPDLLSPLHAYAIQARSVFPDIKCAMNLNSGAMDSPLNRHASFLLDIDIYRDQDVPQNERRIADLLDQIRIKKNDVFETCIKQRARDELFRRATE